MFTLPQAGAAGGIKPKSNLTVSTVTVQDCKEVN